MAKTASYTRKAIDTYNAKFDRVTINLTKGSKEKISRISGKSPAAFCKEVIEKYLESYQDETPAADQDKTTE